MKPHVLVVRLDAAGDVLLTGPAVRAVAAGARFVTLLCGPRGRAAGSLLPGVDQVVVHRAAWIEPDAEPLRPEDVHGLVEELRRLELDRAVIFTSFHQSALPTALVLCLAGIPYIAAISEDYPGALLDVRHPDPGDVHEVERSLALARAAGFPPPPGDDGRLAVRRPESGRRLVDVRPYVVVHPGCSVPARTWQPERFRSLVSRLARDRHVVVTGAAAERDLTAFVAGDEALDLGGKTGLGALAEVLAEADLLVAGNTGPVHLAAAVGTPVVELYAPTVPPARWRPWAVPHVLLGDLEIACAGCRARECPVPRHPCVSCVDVDEALAAVDSLAALEVAA